MAEPQDTSAPQRPVCPHVGPYAAPSSVITIVTQGGSNLPPGTKRLFFSVAGWHRAVGGGFRASPDLTAAFEWLMAGEWIPGVFVLELGPGTQQEGIAALLLVLDAATEADGRFILPPEWDVQRL